ncbi:MAG: NTP transferase domain-containing protein [Alphaproteobacteria bacterium]
MMKADGNGVRVAAVLLAAGESRRMGGANKLLLPVGGEPLVRRAARRLMASRLSNIVVVLGYQRRRVSRAIDDLGLTTVWNAHYREGQMSSVHAGVAGLSGDPDGVMVCLADQPWLETRDYDRLIEAFARRGEKSIVVPTYRGQRGNPIILAHEHRADMLANQRNLGCKHLVTRNPHLVMAFDCGTDRYVRDIDTRADYEALEEA